MAAEFDFSEFSKQDDDGRPLLVPTANITVYWRGSMYAQAEQISDVYTRMLADVAPSLRFFETGAMSGSRKIADDTLDMIPFWLRQQPRKNIYMLRLESGERKDEPSDQAIHFMANEEVANPMGALSLYLPTYAITRHQKEFEERVRHYIGDLEFESGHAGFSLNWDTRGESAYEASIEMAKISRRAPCIDLVELGATMYALRKANPPAIKRVSWLTLIGGRLTHALGGSAAIQAALPSTCQVSRIGRGAVVRAGMQAITGGGRDSRPLLPYRALGSLLRAYRAPHFEGYFGSQSRGEDETQLWLGLFDHA